MKFLKIINCFGDLPRKDIERDFGENFFTNSGFPLRIFISDSYNGMREKSGEQIPWLEGEIRKCKEKRNEKDGRESDK